MLKTLVIALTCFILLVLSPASEVSALDPSPFYDWGSWYKTDSRVLAVTSSTTNASASADVSKHKGLLPGNGFYFLKTFQENIDLVLTLDSKKKEEKRLKQIEERLAETKSLLEKKAYQLVKSNLKRYQSELSKTTTTISFLPKSKNAQDLSAALEQAVAKHSLVLEKLDLVVPEDIREDITNSIITTQRAMDKSSDLLGKAPLPQNLKSRLESLRVLGIISDQELNSLVLLTSRVEVRKKLGELADRDILPESDTKKLDQAQEDYFPNDFLKATEIKKLYEFKKLTQEQPGEDIKKKFEEFSASYSPGLTIPQELLKYWVPLQRYQELKSTLRPDLVTGSILAKDTLEYEKLKAILDSFKPTPEQLKEVDKWILENPDQTPPPDIQRTISLALNLGSTTAWRPPNKVLEKVNTGFPEGLGGKQSENSLIPNSPNQFCLNTVTKAKNAQTAEVKIFANTCLPSGWVLFADKDKSASLPSKTNQKTSSPKESSLGSSQSSQPVAVGSPQSSTQSTNNTKPVGSSCSFDTHTKGIIDADGTRCNFLECESGWYNADSITENGCESQSPTATSSESKYNSSNSYVVAATKSCAPGLIQEPNGVCHCAEGQTFDSVNKACLGVATSTSTQSTKTTPTCNRGMEYVESSGSCQCPVETYFSPGENKCLPKKVCDGYTWDNNADRWCSVANADRGWMSWECKCENYSCKLSWYDQNALATDGCEFYRP